MTVKVKKEKSKSEIKRLADYLKLHRTDITGIQLEDGTILLGNILDIIDDEKTELWIHFVGVAPVPYSEEDTLSDLLEKGRTNPEAMLTSSLYPLSNIHHFIFALSTNKLFLAEKQKVENNNRTEDEGNKTNSNIVNLNAKVQNEVVQEDVKKDDKKVN